MTWYVASCIMAIIQEEGHNGPIPVFENFFLISATSRAEAKKRAIQIGISEAAVDDGTTLDGRPAKTLFMGVRKIRSIYGQSKGMDELPPIDGDELSHSFYHVPDLETVRSLAEGKVVTITYVDDDESIDS